MKKNYWQNYLKRYSLYFFTALFILIFNNVSAQTHTCMDYDNLTLTERAAFGISEQEFQTYLNSKRIPKSGITTFNIPQNYTITPKKFRIKFWSVQTESASLMVPRVNDTDTLIYGKDVDATWLNYDLARRHTKFLNDYYKDQQICFELKEIGVFKTDSIYLSPGISKTIDYSTITVSFIAFQQHAIDKNAYDPNAINIYIRRDMEGGAGGAGGNILFLGQSYLYNSPYNILAHEMGHNFGLEHTHLGNRPLDGTCYMPQYHSGNCERVTRDPNDPNYNALTHGDKVHDTAADPGLFSSQIGSFAHCYNLDGNCNYIGNQVDCTGTPYQLDNSVLRNIMSYGSVTCATDFTPGQRTRMHYLIDNDDSSHPNYTIDFSPVRAALVDPSNLGNFDLMMRNSPEDYGVEPDVTSTMFWQSPDIWVRPTNDNGIYHDNPVYGIGNNYVKVRVVNRGCATSAGEGKLKLYWTKAGTNLPKPVWEGNYNSFSGYPLGGLIGEVSLPSLESYEEHIFTFPWAIPNPANYSGIEDPYHFCLLAKIEAPNDVSLLPQEDNLYYYYLNSNNIALHNVSVIDNTANKSGRIHIGNFESGPRNFKIKFSKDKFYSPNTNIFEEAEIKLTFDNKLWNIWQSNGFQGSNFSMFGEKTVIVNENSEIILKNFTANDFGFVDVKVNFLTDAYTSNEQFGFNVEHWDLETNNLMGGELYSVNKNQRDLFDADAFVMNNTLQAVSINEPAVYNWYDANGTLLHTGQNYTVNHTSGTYLLEVVADYDGYKDMKEVTITPNNGVLLNNIYPNPATSNVTVQYNQLNCTNAYLMLVNVNNNASSNYILNLNNNSININTSPFTSGLYRVVLVCDNNVIESHNLIIQ
ncbi:MAG: hypothetical protein RSC81_02410 [Myroides sp.]